MNMRRLGLLAGAWLLATGCKDESGDEGEVLATEAIGPDGGSITARGLTVTIPPGALSAETEIEIRTTSENLASALPTGGYERASEPLALFPDGLQLKLPARASYEDPADGAVALYEQDRLTVASRGAGAFVNELGTIMLATRVEGEEGGPPGIEVAEPEMSMTFDEPGAAIRDVARFRMSPSDTPRLNLVFTIYDPAGFYEKPLNGTGEGDCGFKFENVRGGSLTTSCAEGPVSGQIRVTSSEVEFDVVPFLAGKMEEPVTVGVIAGGEDLAHWVGFFSFDTGPCYAENCSGRGTCEVEGGQAACVCDEGFAPEGLECVCVPQCDGVQCGFDGCNGQCPPGCSDGEACMEGQCVPDGSGDGDGGSTSDGGSDSGGDSGGSTSGGSGGSSTSGGSSSGGSSTTM